MRTFDDDVLDKRRELESEIAHHQLPMTVAIAARNAADAMDGGLRIDASAWLQIAVRIIRGGPLSPKPHPDAVWDEFANRWDTPGDPALRRKAIDYTGNRA